MIWPAFTHNPFNIRLSLLTSSSFISIAYTQSRRTGIYHPISFAMHLLNIKTHRLEEFFDESIPPYAILSHTWGADEVLYSHICEAGYKPGSSAKVDGCCTQAARDGLDYVWIDTCCIDKSSSAELSEAINSMFAWYRDSVVCYAFLADVPDDGNGTGGGGHEGGRARGKSGSDDNGANDDTSSDDGFKGYGPDSAFAKSRWFTRGWTLQELLAPDNVVFFSASWSVIGSKIRPDPAITGRLLPNPSTGQMAREIRALPTITGIPGDCFNVSWPDFRTASVAQKMSWAAGRKTTRREDRAYSLLGIFGVNMPMLYGEGDNAFVRLQEEILRLTDDQSLLAWSFGLPPTTYGHNLLARSPDDFSKCGSIESDLRASGRHYTMTNKGLQIALEMTDLFEPYNSSLALLTCTNYQEERSSRTGRIALPLRWNGTEDRWFRDPARVPGLDPRDRSYARTVWDSDLTDAYIARETRIPPLSMDDATEVSLVCGQFDLVRGITEVYPEVWSQALKEGKGSKVAHRPPRSTVLFLHNGGGLPPFIARIDPPAMHLMTGIMSCVCLVAWMPAQVHTLSLRDLILEGMEEKEKEGLNLRWCRALDDHEDVNWQTDLDTHDGTTRLSVRVDEDVTRKVVIRFKTSRIEPSASTSQPVNESDSPQKVEAL
jgi:hypothetical protein